MIPIEIRGGVLFGDFLLRHIKRKLLARKREILLSARSDDAPEGCWLLIFAKEITEKNQRLRKINGVWVKTHTYKSIATAEKNQWRVGQAPHLQKHRDG